MATHPPLSMGAGRRGKGPRRGYSRAVGGPRSRNDRTRLLGRASSTQGARSDEGRGSPCNGVRPDRWCVDVGVMRVRRDEVVRLSRLLADLQAEVNATPAPSGLASLSDRIRANVENARCLPSPDRAATLVELERSPPPQSLVPFRHPPEQRPHGQPTDARATSAGSATPTRMPPRQRLLGEAGTKLPRTTGATSLQPCAGTAGPVRSRIRDHLTGRPVVVLGWLRLRARHVASANPVDAPLNAVSFATPPVTWPGEVGHLALLRPIVLTDGGVQNRRRI
jgi:hypothetical protein